jgi:4-amino-4-deoxy-L-arabinose transferase-like glycosyltransferase
MALSQMANMQASLAETRHFDRLYIRQPKVWVSALLLIYLLLAANFALYTPRWQAPDEPAHYNYIAHIAGQGSLPVLQMGDYNQGLLGLLQRTGFQSEPLVGRLRYEAYQPPLYYLLATPVYWVSGGALLALRLFNVVIGAATLALLARSLELVFGGKPLITVTATAFAALLPMHLALTAAVTNDVLAELLVMLSLLLLLQWMRHRFTDQEFSPAQERRQLLALGIALGLGLLTKIYAYALLPVCLMTIVAVAWRRTGEQPLHAVQKALWVAGPALLLGLPWWVRNWVVYGPGDILGTIWHDQVVLGQPRTVDWIAENGFEPYLERGLSLTFRSFWGVFGWLGIFLDERIYTAFLVFSGVIFLGVLWALVRLISGGPDMDMDDFQLWVLALFGFVLLAVAGGYVWYNLKFVQHQGRYLLWGLLPLSTYVALGWREVLRPFQGLITAILACVLAFSLGLISYMSSKIDRWTVTIVLASALFLLCQPLLLIGVQSDVGHWLKRLGHLERPRWLIQGASLLRSVVWAVPFLLLALLNWLIPALYILPQLAGS